MLFFIELQRKLHGAKETGRTGLLDIANQTTFVIDQLREQLPQEFGGGHMTETPVVESPFGFLPPEYSGEEGVISWANVHLNGLSVFVEVNVGKDKPSSHPFSIQTARGLSVILLPKSYVDDPPDYEALLRQVVPPDPKDRDWSSRLYDALHRDPVMRCLRAMTGRVYFPKLDRGLDGSVLNINHPWGYWNQKPHAKEYAQFGNVSLRARDESEWMPFLGKSADQL